MCGQAPVVKPGRTIMRTVTVAHSRLKTPVNMASRPARVGMSERTFGRRFREQTGTTPLQWLLRARVRRAQYLLENSDHPVERIARQAGFGSPTAFRERFRRVVGTTPQSYRAAFHGRNARNATSNAVPAVRPRGRP